MYMYLNVTQRDGRTSAHIQKYQQYCLECVLSGWPSGLRRQTQGGIPCLQTQVQAFWSTYVGVGSNPTSDRIFFSFLFISIMFLIDGCLHMYALTYLNVSLHDVMVVCTIFVINFILTLALSGEEHPGCHSRQEEAVPL